MKRLTEDSVTGETYIKQCASSCPYDGDFCGTDECPVLNKVADKLGEYEWLEEEGLLVKLPCKVGDTVYHVAGGRILEVENVDLFFLLLSVAESRFGNTVFLTCEEAEKKLKEMKNEP